MDADVSARVIVGLGSECGINIIELLPVYPSKARCPAAVISRHSSGSNAKPPQTLTVFSNRVSHLVHSGDEGPRFENDVRYCTIIYREVQSPRGKRNSLSREICLLALDSGFNNDALSDHMNYSECWRGKCMFEKYVARTARLQEEAWGCLLRLL
ncbi:hypothetical protein NDU88_006013 [Pleurodeles waltl]|uniref:Uncharacterized protein n=1 Tax=Pleurodeles waltl TaxID=8319 RepID=A0AAV7SNA4_PLEWA|nr:hypothetical protein NDU88_006013 [Pleurodeles waltl]